jgi:hypothetical protein
MACYWVSFLTFYLGYVASDGIIIEEGCESNTRGLFQCRPTLRDECYSPVEIDHMLSIIKIRELLSCPTQFQCYEQKIIVF